MKKLMLMVAMMAMMLAMPAMAEEEATGDPYPLKVCAVSGEPLGSMGDPIIHVQDGREVRFCCGGCTKKFEKNFEAYLQEVDAKIVEQQKADYPAEKCINSGGDLKDGGVSFVVANRMMKTCCNNCKAKVEGDPASFISKLDEQVIAAQEEDYAMDTCPVSGKSLEGGGENMVVANKLIKLCCNGCKGKVKAEPATYLSKLEE
jgi:hypothetical protein